MDFIIGVVIGAVIMVAAVMISLAKAAKEQDETESELLAEKIEKIKAKRHEKDDQG